MRHWSRVLLEDPKGARKVRQALKYRAEKAKGSKKAAILKEFNYVNRYLDKMNYAELRRRGRAVGSGLQEAACKTLVSQRMKCSGMSWRYSGGKQSCCCAP